MALTPEERAIATRLISEFVRPTAEAAMSLLVTAEVNAPRLQATIANLIAAGMQDSDLIDTSRLADSVQPITFKQLKDAAELLANLTASIRADDRHRSVMAAVVRTITARPE